MASQGNVIDSLIVLLGLDKSNFDKGQKDAQNSLKKTGDEAEKLRKRHEAEAKKTAEAYGAVRDSILGVTAAVVTMVAGGKMLDYLTRNDAAAGRLAGNIGATAREVSILEGVWRRMGSSSADADSFLRNTNKILEEIKLTGTSSALLPFVQGGLNVAAFRDAKTYQDRAAMLARAAGNLTPQDAQFRLQAAGYSEDTIGVLLRNKDALDSLFKSQERLNSVSKEEAGLAQERQTAFNELGQAFEGTGRKIADFFTPILVVALNALKDFVVWTRENVPAASVIIGTLGGALLALKGYSIASTAAAFGGNIASMGAAVGGLIGKLGILGATFGVTFGIGTLLSDHFGLDDKISSLFTGPGPSMAGGYVPGTIKGLGNRGSTLGARNNNPGNLRFANQPGAMQGAGGFAAFGSMTEGIAALEGQLTLDANRGLTLAQIISKYAPAGDGNNVAAYIADVSQRTGIAAGSRIDSSNARQMSSLISAFASHEGNPLYADSINQGMNLAMRQGRGVGAPNVTVGNVTIQTSSSTMTGTGADLGKGLNNYLVAQQANNGIN